MKKLILLSILLIAGCAPTKPTTANFYIGMTEKEFIEQNNINIVTESIVMLSSQVINLSVTEAIVSQAILLGIPQERPAIIVSSFLVKWGFPSPILTELKKHAAPLGSRRISFGLEGSSSLEKPSKIEAAYDPTPAWAITCVGISSPCSANSDKIVW